MRGIILTGGKGTRLYPVTQAISKQILPIYDKPMIYYPLSVLMLAGIREVLIISTPRDLNLFRDLLGDGKKFGLFLSYATQENANGLAEAFLIGESFIGEEGCALILGDNLFYGRAFTETLQKAITLEKGAIIFPYYVQNPKEFGVVEFDEEGKIISLEEKPKHPKSNFIIPGLYFFDSTVVEKAKRVKKSKRGELEILSILEMYLAEKKVFSFHLGRGMMWFDTGTEDSLLDSANFIKTVQQNQRIVIACLEEIAYQKGWITKEMVIQQAEKMKKSKYGKYLFSFIS
ncbi:glucose-1-phosphate thymidylyltransferase RfbA [Fusobacterium gonidiaformans]|uniref:glucose-1-phosphate thymidylyltransferase RfbA n=1 Tax=Fusobacterium gonidiaformans TaxID=849 RepID=UPI0001BC61EC|nr:glucose-1-phosphate thymidylyltransferase RfbA [Fusobacterium gonidiaformans]AVQ17408.1 glucose-1-phosphate thymidylyltransferase [Fusobacterium gonidiaformans ATCC 25563]EFS27814.1 glucose-1-phosphate thymidylyltransferase [Fusobacterium gonidiaformans ATCC 25563]